MKLTEIKVYCVKLPFRFSFGHSLAWRSSSLNLIVKAVVEDASGRKFTGFGESVPRDYVTGETVEGACKSIREDYAPRLEGLTIAAPLDAVQALKEIFASFRLGERPRGASWCAVELAVLDAVARANQLSVASVLSAHDVIRMSQQELSGRFPGQGNALGHVRPQPLSRAAAATASISSYTTYGGVVPFSSKIALNAVLLFYKLYGFKTVKIKVGRNWDDDLSRLEMARKIMGEEAVLRIDANCAWTVEETLYFAEKIRRYKIASIEQPVDAEDIAGMQRLTRELPEAVIADESLCTLTQAKNLISVKGCDAFNIRLSKVGGLLAAADMVDLARANGIGCLLGAQVGESAILSAAGRAFACVKGPFDNCEGSFNRFLLRSDLSLEDITVKPGGKGHLPPGKGLGITIDETKMARLIVNEDEGNHSPAQSVQAVRLK